MRNKAFNWDKLNERHLMVLLAVALLAVAVFLQYTTAAVGAGGDSASSGGNVGATSPALLPRLLSLLLYAAACLAIVWALLSYRSDREHRAILDQSVDAELSRKWQPGFSHVVGAYDKPWYIICGETAVGKTAALRAARLPMALGPDGRPVTDSSQGLNGTFMFDWWFFEDAVVLDSGGDLLENPDQRWSAFLQRIRAARPVQPINGMMLALSAEDVIGVRGTLRGKAALLARQVEEAREQLGVRFPIYLMITKSDLITGFSDFFPPRGDLRGALQILGWSTSEDPRLNDHPLRPADVRAGLEDLVLRLIDYRAAALENTTTYRADAACRIDHLDEMYGLPESLRACLDNLEEFVALLLGHGGFSNSPPFLRGVYFTSALRTGETLDTDLQRVFNLPRLPDTRRAASDQAFFIRELLLEKVIPESGMVTPLEDVVVGIRRRGRVLLAGTAVAAAVVLTGTLVGFWQTAGRIAPHRAFWTAMRDISDRGDLLDSAALFGPQGYYRGQASPLRGAPTLLSLHERATGLARADTASWLLPLSADLDARRRGAHRDVFVNLVLLPALQPPVLSPGAGVDQAVKVMQAMRSTLAEVRGDADAAALRKWAAYWIELRVNESSLASGSHVSSDEAAVIGKLLDAGFRQFPDTLANAGDASAALQAAQRRRLAEADARWLAQWLSAASERLDRFCDVVEPSIVAVRDAADLEAKRLLNGSIQTMSLVDARGRAAELAKYFNGRAEVLQGAPGSLAADVAAALAVPAELTTLAASLDGELGGTGDSPAAAVKSYEKHVAARANDLLTWLGEPGASPQTTAAPAAASTDPNVRRLAIDAAKRFAAQHLGGDEPRIVRRFRDYQALDAALAALLSPAAIESAFAEVSVPSERADAATTSSKPDSAHVYPSPFFRVVRAINVLGGRFDDVQKKLTSPRNAVAPTEEDATRSSAFADANRSSDRVIREVLDRARQEAELGAWKFALAQPQSIWLTASAAASPDRKRQMGLVIAVGSDARLIPRVHPTDDFDPLHLQHWLSHLAGVQNRFQYHANVPTTRRAEVEAGLTAANARLQEYASAYLQQWLDAANRAAEPRIATLSDVKNLATYRDAAAITSEFDQALEPSRTAIAVLTSQNQLPASRDAAAAALKRLAVARQSSSPAESASSAQVIFQFLSSWQIDGGDASDAENVRAKLLFDGKRFDGLPVEQPTAAADAPLIILFYRNLLGRSCEALITAAKPATLGRMQRIFDQADGLYPLDPAGKRDWDKPDLQALRPDLDRLIPIPSYQLAHPVAVQIRDVGGLLASGGKWYESLYALRELDAFMTNPKPFVITIAKHGGKWQAIRVRQVPTDQAGNPKDDRSPGQLYLDAPARFEIGGGADIRLATEIRLLKNAEDNPQDAAQITNDRGLQRPWGLFRFYQSYGSVEQAIPVRDPSAVGAAAIGAAFISVRVEVEGRTPPAMPKQLPPAPGIASGSASRPAASGVR